MHLLLLLSSIVTEVSPFSASVKYLTETYFNCVLSILTIIEFCYVVPFSPCCNFVIKQIFYFFPGTSKNGYLYRSICTSSKPYFLNKLFAKLLASISKLSINVWTPLNKDFYCCNILCLYLRLHYLAPFCRFPIKNDQLG